MLPTNPDKKKATIIYRKGSALYVKIGQSFRLGFMPHPDGDNLSSKKIGTRAVKAKKQALYRGNARWRRKEQPGHYYDLFRDANQSFPIPGGTPAGGVMLLAGAPFGDLKNPKFYFELPPLKTPVSEKPRNSNGLYWKQNQKTPQNTSYQKLLRLLRLLWMSSVAKSQKRGHLR